MTDLFTVENLLEDIRTELREIKKHVQSVDSRIDETYQAMDALVKCKIVEERQQRLKSYAEVDNYS